MKLINIIIILLFIPFCISGTFECVETEICDEYSAEFVFSGSNIIDCYNNDVASVGTEEVFTVNSVLTYTCSGTEDISKTVQINHLEKLSTGQTYQDDDFLHDFVVNCTSAGQKWGFNTYFIHDLNSAKGTIDTKYYYNVDGTDYNCPTDSYFVSSTSPNLLTSTTYDIDDYYSVFEPYPYNYPKTIERGFGVSSILAMQSYYESDFVINDSVINNAIDTLCADDVCSYMPDTLALKNYIENEGYDTLQTSLFGNLGGYTLASDFDEGVKYILTNYQSPIMMKLEISWDYYDATSGFPTPLSFTGDKYFMLLLGYDETNNRYLVQYPEGDRAWWSPALITERWGDNQYEGFYINKKISSKLPNYIIFGDNTEKPSGNILISGYDYYLENDYNLDFYTKNGYTFIDYDNNETYDDIYKTNKSGLFSTNDIYNDDIDLRYYSKNSPISINIPIIELDFDDMDIFNVDLISDDYITEDSEELSLSFEHNYYADVSCKIEDYAETESIEVSYSNFNLSQVCIFDLKDISGDNIFDEGTYLNVTIITTDKGTGIIGTGTFTEEIIYVNYNMDLNPNFPIYCQTNKTCSMYDDDIFSELGTYQTSFLSNIYDEQLTGQQTLDWDNGDIDSSYYVAVGHTDDYAYNINFNTIYTEEGTYNVEYCLNSIHNSDCYNTEIIVLDEIIGGGQSGGSDNEDESGVCIIEPVDNFDYEGCLKDLIIEEFFTKDLEFGYPLPTNTTFNIDLEGEASCYNGNTLYNNLSQITTLYKHTCFDFSDYNICGVDISYNDFLNIYSLEEGTPYKTVDLDYCLVDGSWIACSSSIEFYSGNLVPDEPVGFCVTEPIDYTCNYNCALHDIDSDGVNDCNDICCGYDDVIDSDSDGTPNGCDVCINDADNDIDNDNICGDVDNCVNDYNPNQYDTDSDGVGNMCDICEGGDDNIDSDSDGTPDYCESDSGNGEGDGETDISLFNTCHNGVKDIHIGETYADYGGQCGTCNDGKLSPYIDETYIDYGGLCGYCIEDSTPQKDYVYKSIPNKEYPFNNEQCKTGESVIFFPFFILLLLLLLFVFVLILPIIIIILLTFRKKKKKRKNNKIYK